jgi:hypothetical protein
MTRYAVVYQFLCSNCNHIMVGKPEVDAENAAEASASLRQMTLPCRVCHQSASVMAVVRTFVYPIAPEDVPDSGTGPAVPRT